MAPVPPKNFWGPPTPTLDWCEINYEVSPYVAEFWNTLSNLGMIIPSVFGIHEIIRSGLEKKFIYTHLCLIDYSLLTIWFVKTTLSPLPDNFRSQQGAKFSWIMYGAGVVVVLILDLRLVNYNQCRTCTRLLSAGFFMYTFGFGLWNIDNQLCKQLTNLRTKLPRYFAPITQLHAWWHELAGYATYMHILFEIHARSHFVKPRTQITVKYFGISVEPMYRHRKD